MTSFLVSRLGGRIRHDPRKKLCMFALAFLFRLANAFLVSTFFQPDEYFQAWEPAYFDVHGVGFVSWEWQAAIRTSLVPRLFAGIIGAAEYLGINHLVLGKLFMAVWAALADVYTGLLAERLTRSEQSIAVRAWLISLASAFHWYCSIRPFSNTLEMTLVTVALYHSLSAGLNPWLVSQVLAHITIALRPSNAILWLFIGVRKLLQSKSARGFFVVAFASAGVGALTQLAILALDVHYYNRVVLPYVQFIVHNFGSRVSELYGVLPWHWYISQALPFLLLGYLPVAMLGLRKTPSIVLQIIAINVGVFSLIAHKEFRFIYFLLPLLHIIVALGWERAPRLLKAAALVVNVTVAAYLGCVHQRGVVAVVDYLRQTPAIQDVSFLMPCHSTPWQAHFQRPDDPLFKPQFLTCDPPWNISSTDYVDEADRFYLDPKHFLEENPSKLVSTVVVFEPLQDLMQELGFTVITSFFNGYFNEDWRRQGRVVVMSRLEI